MLTREAEHAPAATSGMTPVQLARASVTYALGGLAYKGVALLTVPILARLVTPAQLGILDLAAVLATVIALVVAVGTDQGMAYWANRTGSPGRLWASAIALVLIGGVAAAILIALVSSRLAGLMVRQTDLAPVFAAAGLYGAVTAVSALMLTTLRLRASPKAYVVAAFLTVLLEMAGALAVAWLLADPVTLMVLAWAAGSAVVAVPFLLRYLPRLQMPKWADASRLLRFGMPFIPVTITWLLGDLWIRGALGNTGALAALGEYGIAFRVVSALGLVVTGFGVAWYPYLYGTADTDVAVRTRTAVKTVIGLLGGGALVLTLLAPELVLVVAGSQYGAAATVVAPLAIGAVALGLFHLAAAVVARSGSTLSVGVVAVAGGIIQAVAASLLIPEVGLVGAGLASAAGYLVSLVIILVLARATLGSGSAALLTIVIAVVAAAHSGQALPILVRVVLATVIAVSVGLLAYRDRELFGGRHA